MFLRVRQAAMAQAPRGSRGARQSRDSARGCLTAGRKGRGRGATGRPCASLAGAGPRRRRDNAGRPGARSLAAATPGCCAQRRAAGWTQVAVRRGRRRTSFPGRGPFGPGRGCRGRGHRKSRGAGGGARDGAGGTVLVKRNTTKVWIWETNILPLAGFRKSRKK